MITSMRRYVLWFHRVALVFVSVELLPLLDRLEEKRNFDIRPPLGSEWGAHANTYCSKGKASVPLVEDDNMGFDITGKKCRTKCDDDSECIFYTYGRWEKWGLHYGKMRCQMYSKCDMNEYVGMTCFVKPHSATPPPSSPGGVLGLVRQSVTYLLAAQMATNLVAFLKPSEAPQCLLISVFLFLPSGWSLWCSDGMLAFPVILLYAMSFFVLGAIWHTWAIYGNDVFNWGVPKSEETTPYGSASPGSSVIEEGTPPASPSGGAGARGPGSAAPEMKYVDLTHYRGWRRTPCTPSNTSAQPVAETVVQQEARQLQSESREGDSRIIKRVAVRASEQEQKPPNVSDMPVEAKPEPKLRQRGRLERSGLDVSTEGSGGREREEDEDEEVEDLSLVAA